MGSLFLGIYFLGFVTHQGLSLFIDGCPMFGCRPSGSFSLYLQVPKENVSVKWMSDFALDPVPNALGCVSDSVSIICPSNGPFSEDKGYVSLFTENGTLRWRDRKLHFPTLPLLDNNGDVTGSDGKKLVHYDSDGKNYPSIPCDGLYPLFNMALVGDSYLLLVSANGFIVVRQTNGVPVGSLTLNATYDGVNGSYLPIAQPVINKQRFYLLTEFSALENKHLKFGAVKSRRLYAIDVCQSISDRIKVAWYMSFPYRAEQSLPKTSGKILTAGQRSHDVANSGTSSLIWNRYNGRIDLITPDSDSGGKNNLFGINDMGGEGEIVFHSSLDVLQIAMFVSDHCEIGTVCNPIDGTGNVGTRPALWAVTNSFEIHQISDQGVSIRQIDLKSLFNKYVSVTTKMSLIRNSDTDADILVFGIQIAGEQTPLQQEKQTTYLVAIDTATDSILWSFSVPNNMIPRGQITGVSGTDMREKDQIIFYAEIPGKSAKILSIH